MNVTDKIQEYGARTIPKDRTGQTKISRKVWYKIPHSGKGVPITTISTEGRVRLPERKQTTKRKSYSDVEKWRKEYSAWEEEQESEALWVKAEVYGSSDEELG